MAENLEKQTQQYQRRFQDFINDIDDGTFDGELNKMVEGHANIPPVLQKNIDEQIKAYQSQSPDASVAGFVNFLGKSVANSFLGPVGLSLQDFQNPDRLADKAKSTAIRGVSSAITQNIPSPNSIINSIKNGKRNKPDSKQDKMAKLDIYSKRVNSKKMLEDETYEPTRYSNAIRPEFKDDYNRIAVIQNNTGDNFYSTYKVLHSEDDTEISDEMSEYLIKFHITNSDDVLIFRMANFSGLTDSVSVSYNDVRYFGRPESLKQYDSVSRSITFSFDVIVDNESDIIPIYNKLDLLMGLCYPNSYTNDNIIQPNIIKLSLGRYIRQLPFFITSLSYTSNDELVFSEGKPRLVTINVNGDIIQPRSNPMLDKEGRLAAFVGNYTLDEQESYSDAREEALNEMAKNEPNTNLPYNNVSNNNNTGDTEITGVPDF